MSAAAIDLEFTTGVIVVLAGTTGAAAVLGATAEALLVTGVEVEVVRSIDRNPEALAAMVAALARPAVIAVVHAGDAADVAAAGAADGPHLWVDCPDTVTGRAVVQRILDATHEQLRRELACEEANFADSAEITVGDDATIAAGPELRALTIVPPPSPSRRHPLRWAGVAVVATAATILAVVPRPTTIAIERLEIAEPPPSSSGLPHVPFAAAAPAVPEIAAQGPAPEVTAAAPTAAPLAGALAHGQALALDDLVVHQVVGDNDWFAAMTLCRARGFWGTRGWRIPSTAELHAIARSRRFGDVGTAWSSARTSGDRDRAMVVDLASGRVESAPKWDASVATVCVRTLVPGASRHAQ